MILLAATACELAGSQDDLPDSACWCTAHVTASATIDLTAEQLDGVTATICRNRECATGTLNVGSGSSLGTPGDLFTTVELAGQGSAELITFVMPYDSGFDLLQRGLGPMHGGRHHDAVIARA